VNENVDIFQGLDEVVWADVHHAYGPAIDVPDLLRLLTSSSRERRLEAWHELYGNLWHQGTIYEATACAVPFFIQLLQADHVSDKAEVLAYLAALFQGKGYWEVHGRRSRPDKPTAVELEGIVLQERAWAETIRSAIRKGRETYFHLLQTGDSRTKLSSAYLLGLLGEDNLEIIEEILKEGS